MIATQEAPALEFPHDVAGWLSESEGRCLAEVARDRRVLEIGAFHGRSTICIASTALSVEVIDPCDGRATPSPGDTAEALIANLSRHGVRGKVRLHIGTTAEVAQNLAPGFDLVFIDGDHSRAAVDLDVREALRLLAPGGAIVFHDYKTAHPDVTAAVNELIASGSQLLGVVGTIAVVRPSAIRKSAKPIVLLGMPRRAAWAGFGACQGFHLWPTVGGCEVVRSDTSGSILDHTFNRLWCAALNARKQGVSHFAMIHDDIGPCQGWLDILLREMALTGADVLSAVVPIKTENGLTSTAIETDDLWRPRRLTMHEAHELPETFTDGDVGGELLLNSGLWVCDLRKPWIDDPEPLFFQTLNRLVKNAEGELEAQVRSEDWEFSRAARSRGAKLFATRKVALFHAGEQQFPNDQAWGTWKTDEVYTERMRVEAGVAARVPAEV